MTAGMLAVSDLSTGYGARGVLFGVTLPPLHAGRLVAIVGPNGAGKSTLLRAIAQALLYRGKVAFEGQDLAAMPMRSRARLVGLMPQSLPQETGLGVLESLLIPIHVAHDGMPARHAEELALDRLRQLKIAGLAMEQLDQLSGGQRQLVSLAQTIACDPRVLLLDEPCSALDLARQFQMMQEARRLAREGRVVIAILHDLTLAAQWADLMIVLHGGRVHSTGAPQDVLTPVMLADVYGVSALVERNSLGCLQLTVLPA